jgi:CHAT domain-containing protein
LLAAAMIAVGQPQQERAVDRTRATRLRAAAVERVAQLDDDSALVLYRAARSADPGYLPAQLEYIVMMLSRFRRAELNRELAASDSSSPLQQCLSAGSRIVAEDSRPLAQLRALEKRYGPTPCTDIFTIAFAVEWGPGRTARAARASPEIPSAWWGVAKEKYDAKQWKAADDALDAGLKAVDNPMGRVSLLLTKIYFRNGRGDSLGSLAAWNELATFVRRDGRPGPAAAYSGQRCANLNFRVPGLTPEAQAEECRRFYAIVRPRRAWLAEYDVTRWIAKPLTETGDLVRALPSHNRLVALADSMGAPGLQMEAYTLRGRLHAKAGRLVPAQRDLEHAVKFGPAAEYPYYLADAYHNLAHAYEGAGRFAEAAAAADSFAATADLLPLAPARWMSRHDAGVIRMAAGLHAAADRDFALMVRLVDQVGGDGHYFAGEYLERKGELGQALEYYRTGARMEFTDPRNLTALARVHEALGFPDSAEAAAIRHDTAGRWPITEGPLMPDLLAARGRMREAIALADAWAQRATKAGNVEGAAIAHLRVAELLLANKEPKAALVSATSADSLTRILELKAHAIKARTLRGRAMMDQGMQVAGLAELRSAVRLAEANPSIEGLRSTNLALGNALEVTGRRADALVAYDRAASAVEKLTAGLNQDAYRAGFKASHMAPFDGAMRLLLKDGSESAVAWSVRRKAAALTLAGQSGVRSSRVASRVSVTALRQRLGADEALIDFTVLDSTVFALVVSREGVKRFELSASATQLAAWVESLRRPLVTTPGGQIDLAHAPFDASAAANLYRALIGELEPALVGVTRLAIAPDGALWYVPFAALVTGRANGRASYLVERYEVRLLPSAQFLGAQGGSSLPSGFRVEAFSYSVPGGDAELSAIQKSVGASRVVSRSGAGATERAALGAKASVLHLAVHGSVDDRDPSASHLRLAAAGSDDGLLHLTEVASRRGQPQLVVLTACEAVSGRLYAGEGLVGLARAFLVSGARQVIASEWPVAASAADLTGVLYKELAIGRTPAAALRSAQLALLGAPGTAHPIHWAGFVVFEGNVLP